MKVNMRKFFVSFGAVFGFLGVAAGAFGAHALRAHFANHPDLESVMHTATQYQMYHALALIAVGLLAEKTPGKLINFAGYAFFGGIIIFSGSLYALVLSTHHIFGAITPIGGAMFLVGWVSLFLAARKLDD